MRKIVQIACCALGSGMIGYFANKFDSIAGAVFFTAGVAMLAGSIAAISKQGENNTEG